MHLDVLVTYRLNMTDDERDVVSEALTASKRKLAGALLEDLPAHVVHDNEVVTTYRMEVTPMELIEVCRALRCLKSDAAIKVNYKIQQQRNKQHTLAYESSCHALESAASELGLESEDYDGDESQDDAGSNVKCSQSEREQLRQ